METKKRLISYKPSLASVKGAGKGIARSALDAAEAAVGAYNALPQPAQAAVKARLVAAATSKPAPVIGRAAPVIGKVASVNPLVAAGIEVATTVAARPEVQAAVKETAARALQSVRQRLDTPLEPQIKSVQPRRLRPR